MKFEQKKVELKSDLSSTKMTAWPCRPVLSVPTEVHLQETGSNRAIMFEKEFQSAEELPDNPPKK